MTKRTKAEVAQARDRLLRILKPGDEVTCVLRHVSSSGMTRDIDLFKLEGQADGSVVRYWLSGDAAAVLGWSCSDKTHDALRVSGAGMDMGFHAVYTLAQVLWSGEGRGGYMLKHRWL